MSSEESLSHAFSAAFEDSGNKWAWPYGGGTPPLSRLGGEGANGSLKGGRIGRAMSTRGRVGGEKVGVAGRILRGGVTEDVGGRGKMRLLGTVGKRVGNLSVRSDREGSETDNRKLIKEMSLHFSQNILFLFGNTKVTVHNKNYNELLSLRWPAPKLQEEFFAQSNHSM